MHDTVIRGGTLIDGSGEPRRTADIAIDGALVTEVGSVAGKGREEIDAGGLLVTPGFVDIHTHYDGQVTWDPLLEPSFWHGVTTVVMGNCGVGFAPAKPDSRTWLVGLMEGVEDIPGTALFEGIRWQWESFPEYLDALETTPHAIDFGVQIAHGPVRAYVMGERGAKNAEPSKEDIDGMARVVREAMDAGALGFSTSRTIIHVAIDGEPVPGTFAAREELLAMARAVADAGHGILEVAPAGIAGEDDLAPVKEMAWMRDISAETGCPVTFLMGQNSTAPEAWREMLSLADEARKAGARIYPQVAGRATNLLFGFEGVSPFSRYPSFLPLMDMSFEKRLPILRDPAFKARLMAETDPNDDIFAAIIADPWDRVFVLGDPPDYEPDPEGSVAKLAAAERRDPRDLAYDLMLEDDGRAMLFWPLLGYNDGNLEPVREMLSHPGTVVGASDGGAHCRVISDASMPTFMLTHWARDRSRGQTFDLEWIIAKQTHGTAQLYGFGDRGLLAPGYKADINLIDFERLDPGVPRMHYDLPAGAPRLMQKATGYVRTIVSGQTVRMGDEATGARPGHLVRGRRQGQLAA